MATTTFWAKQSLDGPPSQKNPKLFNYLIRLESESPTESDEDTESVYSVQEKTTDTVKDTTDTDTNPDNEFEVEIEYEVASLSDSDQETYVESSSEPEDFMLAAAAICDSSLETFITDAEDSDNSFQHDDSSAHSLIDTFWTCIQCHVQNDNPQFQYCEKCYQTCKVCKVRKTYKCFLQCNKCFKERKTSLPLRPRRFRKARRSKTSSPVKLDALKSCLSSLSQDSGVGSSQEFSSLGSSQEFPQLKLDQIVVPEHLEKGTEKASTSQNNNNINTLVTAKNRKRHISESSLSEYEVPTPKRTKISNNNNSTKNNCKTENKLNQSSSSYESGSSSGVEKGISLERTISADSMSLEYKELCIACHSTPKNSIFLHGRIAHMCCCYKCAMRTWRQSKRCPICNRRVNNVVRVFTT